MYWMLIRTARRMTFARAAVVGAVIGWAEILAEHTERRGNCDGERGAP